MDTLRYIVKRLLMAIFILLGVSVIIYGLSRMLPADYVDNTYASQVNQGLMSQEDVDRIKEIYGLYMPDAYLSLKIEGGQHDYSGKKFTKKTKKDTYAEKQDGRTSIVKWYAGTYDWKKYRIVLDEAEDEDLVRDEENSDKIVACTGVYNLYEVHKRGWSTSGEGEGSSNEDTLVTIDEELIPIESGTYTVETTGAGDKISFAVSGSTYTVSAHYRAASFGDKAGAILSGYFTWLGNLLKGDLGVSFVYKKPVGEVITEFMGISFGIAFVATILQFLIAIPLGIKAATNQYGVIDYTVTVLTMIGISLPTFFLGAIVIRLFSVGMGAFPVGGLKSPGLAEGTAGIVVFGDMIWHMILPMFVLVVLSIGSLMRYTRTNTLEVLNADYIRTARAKGLSERTVIYKHAFRNTMIPIVTLLAGVLPSLFCGAMITEEVFALPGIGMKALAALRAGDVPFIMGYNMFIAIMTVLGTLLSDIMYAVVDPRVKLGK